MSKPVLQIENLNKTFTLGKRDINALSNLNLTVNSGEFVAIMGPSGSGKTTLLNIIGAIDKPTSGQVLLDGIDVAKMPENQLYKVRRDKMGFETPADVWLRGRELGELRRRLFAPGLLHQWVDRRAMESRLEEYLAGRPIGLQVWRWLSLESWLRRYVVNPSFSEQPAPGRFPGRRASAFVGSPRPGGEIAAGAARR